ncbi:MAG: sugar MFS transporter [Bacteroidales bacterium]|jgi:glucose/galactose transporter|nr:sugar MFS transporter [Bacteroidales bacterium]MDD4703242.1 sugar MFS transporter [Bacteroidales bacterium]MDX9798183.1 sugar MFS transporter [Bacteroidales bacterium]
MTKKNNGLIFSLTIIGILYFIFGFITWLNSVLIPFLKEACELSDSQAYLVTFAFYISYFVMALPSSWVLKKTGFAKGMALGLLVMAIGSLVFIPAANERNYIIFLVGLFLQGTGLALLQTAANPYVTILGPIESAAKRMSIMGLFNKIAGMIGIFWLSKVLFSDMSTLSEHLKTLSGDARLLELDLLAQRIVPPYIGIAVGLVLLAFMVLMARLPKVENQESEYEKAQERSIFEFPYLWLGVLALFLYVGVEVIAIDTLGLYAQSQGVAKEIAPMLGTFSLIALTIGYVLGIILVPKYISQSRALTYCAVLGLAFAILALTTSGIASIVFIILLSFAHALMWPGIWPLAIDKLGKHTPVASALLIMAIAGGAILPLIYGHWATIIDNRQIPYLILIPCYIYIAYYSIKGYKIGKKN